MSIPTGIRELVEFVTLIGLLVLFSTGPVYFISQHLLHSQSNWEARPIKVGFLVCGVVSAIVWTSMATDHRIIRFRSTLVPGALFVVMAVASTWWSILPRQTMWRSTVYIGMFLMAWALASLEFERFWTVILAFSGSATLASIVVVVLRPSMGIAESGYWRGIYTSPNSLGPVSALFMMALAVIAIIDERRSTRMITGLFGLAALVTLVRSNATTSMMALVIAAVTATTGWAIAYLVQRGRRNAARNSVIGAVTAAVVLGIPTVLVATRTSGMRQRLEVWPIVWERILIKPWTGYGFFTYWGTRTSMHPRTIGRAGSAHNSVLESGLDTGMIGMAITLVLLTVAVVVGVNRVRHMPTVSNVALLALTVFVVLSHMTESFISWFSYMWILLVVLSAHPGELGTRRERVGPDPAIQDMADGG